jgi:IMP dehydrogenase
MEKTISNPAYSLKDFRLLPGYTTEKCGLGEISLRSRLCSRGEDYIFLDLPFISAAMQSVTGIQLATALAELGGVGVIPLGNSIEAQCMKVRKVKQYKAGFQTDIICFSPSQKLLEVQKTIEKNGFNTFPVTDNGLFHGRFVGIITDKYFDSRFDLDKTVEDRMKIDPQVGIDVHDLKEANRLMIKFGHGFLPVISIEGTLQAVVFKKDLDKHIKFPDATVDDQKRLRVGAAVSTHSEDRDRVAELIENGVDFLVIDASDGFTVYQKNMIEWIKQTYQIPVIGGNVVDGKAFDKLVEAGADGIKVGMGIGSGCITQEVRATGRGQATALIEVVKSRDYYAEDNRYIPVIADGGISCPSDIAIALAIGADCVMMGNFFARLDESPGRTHLVNGKKLKEYWMEGSLIGHNYRRYQKNSSSFFEEGVHGFVPSEGSIYDILPVARKRLISTLSTAGVSNMDEFHEWSVIELQSRHAIEDSRVHNMVMRDIPFEILN